MVVLCTYTGRKRELVTPGQKKLEHRDSSTISELFLSSIQFLMNTSINILGNEIRANRKNLTNLIRILEDVVVWAELEFEVALVVGRDVDHHRDERTLEQVQSNRWQSGSRETDKHSPESPSHLAKLVVEREAILLTVYLRVIIR